MADSGLRDAKRSRWELAAVLLGGAAGGVAVLLASRQTLARVAVQAPAPLPVSLTDVSAQDIRPAVGALAIAAFASLAAVLATAGMLRRITGFVTAALGAGVGVLAAAPVTASEVLAAARSAAGTAAAAAGGGTSAGSVSAGGTGQGSGDGLQISGMPVHVAAAGAGWRAVMIVGSLALVAAGLAALVRARRMPVMSARYDRSGGTDARVTAEAHDSQHSTKAGAAGGGDRLGGPGTASGLWEALSAGEDPTA